MKIVKIALNISKYGSKIEKMSRDNLANLILPLGHYPVAPKIVT